MRQTGSGACSGLGLKELTHAPEELVGHHLRDAAQQALAHAGDEAADLHVGAVADTGTARNIGQRDQGLPADEARPAAPLHPQSIRLRRLLVTDAYLALERAFHSRYPDLHRRPVLVLSDQLELLAPGNGLTEHFRVEKRLPDLLSGCRDIVAAFDLHRGLLGISRSSREKAGSGVKRGGDLTRVPRAPDPHAGDTRGLNGSVERQDLGRSDRK